VDLFRYPSLVHCVLYAYKRGGGDIDFLFIYSHTVDTSLSICPIYRGSAKIRVSPRCSNTVMAAAKFI
jgi:hypothetical protein